MTFAYRNPKERLSTIQTPLVVSEWLCSLVRPKVRPTYVVDPCCGEGNLLKPWTDLNRRPRAQMTHATVGIDVKPEYAGATSKMDYFICDHFEHFTLNQMAEATGIDDDDMMSQHRPLIMCNPPFNGNWKKSSYPEVFLRKIVELWGRDVPIVFMAPMGFRLNQKKLSDRTTWMRDHGPIITSLIACPVDMYEETQFHTEIILFNIPGLEPHYWLPAKVRSEL